MLAIQTVPVSGDLVDEIYDTKVVEFPSVDVPVNGYVIFQNILDKKHAVIVRYLGNDTWQRITPSKHMRVNGLEPRDAAQAAFMDCLLDPRLLINVAVGQAGTGKTTLALAKAADDWLKKERRIILSKPTVTVGAGRAFGPVPGTIEEKYDPYLQSYRIVLDKIFQKDKVFVSRMVAKGDLQFQPVELARGCTFDNCTFILDEAQNLTWHELNTIISRIGENAEMIILGDLKQVDIPIRSTETGLYKLVNALPFQRSDIASAIELQTQYRSPITALVAEVNEWVSQTQSERELEALLD